MSSDYKMEILRKAKKEGYFIKCVFVLTIDPQINIARIKSRVAAGGHDVEKSKVIDRYYKSINNIKKLVELKKVFTTLLKDYYITNRRYKDALFL